MFPINWNFDTEFDEFSSKTSATRLVYQLCDNQSTLQTALTSLRSASSLIMDCEARNLGNQGGVLSIISLRSTTSTDIFLIDVVRLNGSLSPLFHLLESTEVVKIMFDGRMDFSALYHEFGIHLKNVLDLQLADIYSRRVRRETDARRISRLQPYLPACKIASAPGLYTRAIKLGGLSQCVREHLGRSESKQPVNHDNWLKRPLSQAYLSYAATDIHLMALLYDKFVAKGYINTMELGEQSTRYVELWKKSQPVCEDYYKRHPLLPVEILVPPSDGIKKTCRGCEREVIQASMSADGSLCHICKIVAGKNSHMVSPRRRY
ncbi:ribonuclease H-like domain-containing protein [Collybia nuda]|uniref:Ribonuclease H-like domain-containing protein n=1 Tax=Collybia nuda TaxID=64659 RepID=A0A9P5YFC5_9AGAR|nr:ribonuclease H-like domain-containing protein [Collybia nuda]